MTTEATVGTDATTTPAGGVRLRPSVCELAISLVVVYMLYHVIGDRFLVWIFAPSCWTTAAGFVDGTV